MKSAVSSAAACKLEAVDRDVVLRQPRSQGDVGTEDRDVVQAEPPHANVTKRAEHLTHGTALARHPVLAWRDGPDHDRHGDKGDRVDRGDQPPPTLDEATQVDAAGRRSDQGRADELRERGTDVAGSEDAQGEPLVLTGEPGGVPGDADTEEVAGESDEEGQDQQQPVGQLELGHQVGRNRRDEQHGDRDHPATDPIGQHAQEAAARSSR